MNETRRMVPPRTWTVAQVCKLLGYSAKKQLLKEIHRKRLKARPAPGQRKSESPRYHPTLIIAHEDLCRWLLSSGFPLEDFRYMLNPQTSLLSVGLTEAQTKALFSAGVVPAATMFRLGQLTRERYAWGIVVSFAAVGFDEAIALAREYSRVAGRPYLIAITNQTRGTVRVADLFDLILPEPCEPSALAAALRRVKKYGETDRTKKLPPIRVHRKRRKV